MAGPDSNRQSVDDNKIHQFLLTTLRGKTVGPVQAFLENHNPAYPLKDFPLSAERFARFRRHITDALQQSVTEFSYRELNARLIDENFYKIFLVELATGEKLPVVTCKHRTMGLRTNAPLERRRKIPIAVFSGHSNNGLFDLLVDDSSYQKAMAKRLCDEKYPVAVAGKIDSGFASRDWPGDENPSGRDEQLIGLLLQGTSVPLASRQLSLAVAAVEIAKQEFKNKNVATLGVALGGWVAVHAALVSKDVAGVMDFGGHNTLYEQYDVDNFSGLRDFSQVFPMLLDLGDRSLFQLALAGQTPLLLAHGNKERKIVQEGWNIIKQRTVAQYQALNYGSCLMVLEHEGGHEFTDESVSAISFFYENFIANGACREFSKPESSFVE